MRKFLYLMKRIVSPPPYSLNYILRAFLTPAFIGVIFSYYYILRELFGKKGNKGWRKIWAGDKKVHRISPKGLHHISDRVFKKVFSLRYGMRKTTLIFKH